jgi:hypothetical protein
MIAFRLCFNALRSTSVILRRKLKFCDLNCDRTLRLRPCRRRRRLPLFNLELVEDELSITSTAGASPTASTGRVAGPKELEQAENTHFHIRIYVHCLNGEKKMIKAAYLQSRTELQRHHPHLQMQRLIQHPLFGI